MGSLLTKSSRGLLFSCVIERTEEILGGDWRRFSAWRFRLEPGDGSELCGNNPTHPTTSRIIMVRLDLLIVMWGDSVP